MKLLKKKVKKVDVNVNVNNASDSSSTSGSSSVDSEAEEIGEERSTFSLDEGEELAGEGEVYTTSTDATSTSSTSTSTSKKKKKRSRSAGPSTPSSSSFFQEEKWPTQALHLDDMYHRIDGCQLECPHVNIPRWQAVPECMDVTPPAMDDNTLICQKICAMVKKLHPVDDDRVAQIIDLMDRNEMQADAKITGKGSRRLLHYACARGNHLLVSQLIQRGAKVNRITDNGWTALHFNATWRDLKKLEMKKKENNVNMGNSAVRPRRLGKYMKGRNTNAVSDKSRRSRLSESDSEEPENAYYFNHYEKSRRHASAKSGSHERNRNNPDEPTKFSWARKESKKLNETADELNDEGEGGGEDDSDTAHLEQPMSDNVPHGNDLTFTDTTFEEDGEVGEDFINCDHGALVCRLLITNGANPNVEVKRDKTHRSPLHQALQRRRHRIAEELLAAGAKSNYFIDTKGNTLLDLVVSKNDLKGLMLLFQYGANVNYVEPHEVSHQGIGQSWTPLHRAVNQLPPGPQLLEPAMVKLLVQMGSNKDTSAHFGSKRSAAQMAKDMELDLVNQFFYTVDRRRLKGAFDPSERMETQWKKTGIQDVGGEEENRSLNNREEVKVTKEEEVRVNPVTGLKEKQFEVKVETDEYSSETQSSTPSDDVTSERRS